MKVGDRVKFKSFNKWKTGTILAINAYDILSIKVSPDRVEGEFNFRKKIALKPTRVFKID